MLYSSLLDLIGNTPLVETPRLSPKPTVRIFCKLEGQNPTGSVKDRIVLHMLAHAEGEGRIRPGDTVVEASTGNTGIALALVCRAAGYRAVVVTPQNVYPRIPEILRAYRAQVLTTPQDLGIRGAVERARALAAERGWFFLGQFHNPQNVRTHALTTGAEILRDLPRVDAFVAGLGTGGTLMGTGQRLKAANPRALVVAVEPHPGMQVQGLKSLRDGFVPPILDLEALDGKILVRGVTAFRAARELLRREGIFAGPSSGAALHGALRLAQRLRRGTVVVIFADGGWKYLPSTLWTEEPPEEEHEALDDVIWW